MKTLFRSLLAGISLFAATTASAGSDAGKDSARHYKSYPENFDGKTVSVDCTFITRINGGPQVEGVAFFIAHTADTDNEMRGGAIVVAVTEAKADSLVKKYGNVPERNGSKNSTADKVESKRLRGTFHQLGKGHVYIDVNGDAHELVLAKIEDAKSKIKAGDGIPNGGNGRPYNRPHGPKRYK